MDKMDAILAQDVGSASIEHHGVKGQKWGVRRRVQALVGGSGQVPKSAAAASESREKSWKKVYANRASMSTPQLREKVNRLTLENQLKQQVSIASPAKKSAARQIITNVGTELVKNVARQQGERLLKEALTKMAS
jgi:predicted GIY-YIG superfamily endonuclease